jgi:hypothetical protein
MRPTRRTTSLLVAAAVAVAGTALLTDPDRQGQRSGADRPAPADSAATAGPAPGEGADPTFADATVKYLAPGEFTSVVDGGGRLPSAAGTPLM